MDTVALHFGLPRSFPTVMVAEWDQVVTLGDEPASSELAAFFGRSHIGFDGVVLPVDGPHENTDTLE